MARKVANGNAENAEKVAENARDLFNCIRHSHSRSTTKWLPPPLAGSGRGLVVVGGVYLRYPLVYARHRQLTLVLEGVFDELGVGERRFLRPACFAVVGSHVPRGGGKQLDGSGGVEGGPHRLAAHKVYATAAGSSR